jgi:hypothetical protein
MLDPNNFEIVKVVMQEPNWDRAYIQYRSKKPIQQIEEEERLKKEAEQNRQYTDEELKAFAEINSPVEPKTLSSKKEEEKPADAFDVHEVYSNHDQVKE